MTRLTHIATLALAAILLQGCGSGGARDQLSDNEMHVRNAAEGLAAPGTQGWAGNLGSSILNFEMPWSSRESDSEDTYINNMFRRRFDSQEARYTAIVDDALRAEIALEAFTLSAAEVVVEDEGRLAGLIEMIATGQAENDDMISTMNRVRRNRLAVGEGVTEAHAWTQTFIEARDRADMELPGSAQAMQLARSVNNMRRWSNDLVRISDRMNTSSERVANQFRSGR